MASVQQLLKIKSIRKEEHFAFNMLDFRFFINSENGSALYFKPPKVFNWLAIVPYVLAMELIYFRVKRYFVKIKEQVVGTFVLREKTDALYLFSLAVNPLYRRLGIATHILSYSEKMAKQMNKQWLELSVLKKNTPALRLYKKWGFTKKQEKKRAFILRKRMKND